MSVVKWLKNVSIAKKLYFTVGIMGLLIVIELCTLFFAINTLSSVRAYVGAEGLWSKAQKDAIYNLQKYGITHDEKDFKAYQDFLKVNLGDHKTRLELEKKDPNFEIARQGFLEGRFHPDDIDGAIKLVRRFHDVYYIARAIEVWRKGDSGISEIIVIGNKLHAEISSTASSPEQINAILKQIDPINNKLTQIEDDFSYTLGAGSRWLADLILTLLFSIVLTVEISGLSLTIFVSRGIAKGLNEIIRSAKRITSGDFTTRAKVFSADEIGILANSFNDMTGQLDSNIQALKTSEAELQKSKELAEQSIVIKDHFLANMSHEIRTPMNAIVGFTNLLDNTPLTEDQKQFVDAIRISGQNLTVIINDILDYSKIRSGMIILDQAPLSIRNVLNSIHALLQPKAHEKNLAFKFDIDKNVPETIMGDPIRLTQILTNLADNALKFTEKGHVDIKVALVKETDDHAAIEFKVSDTGKGVPIDKQDIIFERFTQAIEDTNRRYGGTGLGLSIVKSLLELHNSTIALKSETDKGSEFTFVIAFPKDKTSRATPPLLQSPPGSVAGQNIKVLCAEDNPLNQRLVMFFSKNSGFDTEIAENGRIAIEKLQAKQYDVVLMDIQMPEMDGYEATTEIRNKLKSSIPIIALTAHSMSGEKEKCLALGMNAFVSKPFDPKELQAKIVALSGRQKTA